MHAKKIQIAATRLEFHLLRYSSLSSESTIARLNKKPLLGSGKIFHIDQHQSGNCMPVTRPTGIDYLVQRF
jgi:hypothetical protein